MFQPSSQFGSVIEIMLRNSKFQRTALFNSSLSTPPARPRPRTSRALNVLMFIKWCLKTLNEPAWNRNNYFSISQTENRQKTKAIKSHWMVINSTKLLLQYLDALNADAFICSVNCTLIYLDIIHRLYFIYLKGWKQFVSWLHGHYVKSIQYSNKSNNVRGQ